RRPVRPLPAPLCAYERCRARIGDAAAVGDRYARCGVHMTRGAHGTLPLHDRPQPHYPNGGDLIDTQGDTMSTYTLPLSVDRPTAAPKTAYLIASGDLRESANTAGWPTQVQMEAAITAAFAVLGWTVVRANAVDPNTGHGFISSQRMGLEVFKGIP